MQNESEITFRTGDCLAVLQELDSASFDLVYLDPPFFTQKIHRLSPRERICEFSFDDLWSSSREYAEFLYDRLLELHRVLSETGSIFFHCDTKATHIIRALLDDIFGVLMFRSEIIWQYRRWSNSSRKLLPAHQTIFYYTKSDSYTFNLLLQEYSPSTNVDQILQKRARDEHNKSTYLRDEEGRIVTNGAKKGVPLSDVWDIPYLNPKAKERSGYPTQKPLLLLERIVELASNEGDKVLDPFCGSGTTLVAAKMLGRRGIGIDTSAEAIELAQERIRHPQKSQSKLLTNGRDSYRNADKFAMEFLQHLDCIPVQRNKGIDAFLREEFEGSAVPVRVQRPNEPLQEAASKLIKASRGKSAKLMFLIATSQFDATTLTPSIPANVKVVESSAVQIKSHLGFPHLIDFSTDDSGDAGHFSRPVQTTLFDA